MSVKSKVTCGISGGPNAGIFYYYTCIRNTFVISINNTAGKLCKCENGH